MLTRGRGGGMLDSTPVQASMSDRRPGRRHSRRWWLLLSGAVALVLAGAGLVVVEPLWHALPLPTAELTLPTSYVIPGTAPVLPWPSVGQAAVDIEGVGALGTSGTPTPVPIASVAKMMTAYLVLTGHPLAVGVAGPTLTVSAAQAAAYTQEAARGESVVKVSTGAVFTERQGLQALMLPSANNMARILAAWDAGSIDGFVAKMNAAATALGMSGTHYTDPAGYDPGTVSTAADQVILAHKAMESPAFAEIVAQPKATVPVAGVIANVNTLLGQDGVIGIKTGSTDQAGGCLVFAARFTIGTTQLTIIGAILAQPGSGSPQQLRVVFQATQLLIRAVAKALAVYTVMRAGTTIAVVHGPLGTGTTLNAAEDLKVIGWPGMEVRFAADIPPMPARLAAGAEHGGLTATAGAEPPVKTSLRSGEQLRQPDTWTRIKHHR